MNKEKWFDNIENSLTKDFYLNQSTEEQFEGFETALSFGTAGIRGKFGLGEGRLNKYTVQKIALGISKYVLNEIDKKEVVIHYDTRYFSKDFANIIAKVLSSFKIKVYLSYEYKTTPELSYSVRYLETGLGIMITASHNPKDYNGIKVYGSDGAQLSTTNSSKLSEYINKLDNSLEIDKIYNFKKNNNYIFPVPKEVTTSYFEEIKKLIDFIPKSNLKVIFSSLHGTSFPIVPNLLSELDFNNYYLVEKQCKPDPEFGSVDSANPEDMNAFNQAISLAKQKEGDLIICTDPDADRLGIVERDNNGNLYYFNGNEIGTLLLNYRIRQTKDFTNRIMIQSIVSGELAKSLAKYYGINYKEVLTGFKYIAEEINNLKDCKFILGYEESYGFLADTFVRDKDAIQIVPLLIKYKSELKNKNKLLYEELKEIKEKVGNHKDRLFSHTLEGKVGQEKIFKLMEYVRKNPPHKIVNLNVISIEDYEIGKRHNYLDNSEEDINLPTANVIKIFFKEGFIALRPSGTEPKIKLYISLDIESFDIISNEIINRLLNFIKRL
ncbi:phospho-sugar mutase [Staphylococcus hominis]|uniref:phospho-sugar mutase n=1 Tax=Staphylococcus hominis TaxID=1290 RepID=UPI0011A1559B|nr:phospho-sugar mutase [Staphylococcus hominis]MCI2888811.1 phospho-sugar mutase [Staphylococcus hominis]MCI2892311.1 phospho-sugar mutase [Staphylococcus hominis]MDU3829973.1 phospho-sugar mutase [Staphylococcus sp.]MDU7695001.1 phospho-sugar mutase [Staphylococcus sp.]